MNDSYKITKGNLTIARIKNFELRYKVFLAKHNYTTHDIEIVKWETENNALNKRNYCYTIASFNSKGNLVDCCNRLLNSIETIEDLDNLKNLASIGYLIVTATEPTNIEL